MPRRALAGNQRERGVRLEHLSPWLLCRITEVWLAMPLNWKSELLWRCTLHTVSLTTQPLFPGSGSCFLLSAPLVRREQLSGITTKNHLVLSLHHAHAFVSNPSSQSIQFNWAIYFSPGPWLVLLATLRNIPDVKSHENVQISWKLIKQYY